MKHRVLICTIAALIAAVVILPSASTADTVVTPSNMNGWVVGTQSALGGSPIWRFTVSIGRSSTSSPSAVPAGSGAFKMFTDVLTPDPAVPLDMEKIYFGTNNHSDLHLKDITSFKYYTYVHSAHYNPADGWPDGQPPIVELITDTTATTQQRRFVYKPWGWMGESGVAFDTWQEWDLMAENSGRWEMVGTNATLNAYGDWNWLINRYDSTGTTPMKLATPLVGDYTAYYSADLKYSNQSGTSLSIRVGSGKINDWMLDRSIMTWVQKPWWKESCGIDAYTDKLVIGINGVETVYDFEPDVLPVSPVGINPSSCRDKIIGSVRDKCLFVVFGKVMDGPNGAEFFLDDGGGKKIKVVAPNGVEAGQYWRAEGYLQWDPVALRNDLIVIDPYGNGLSMLYP